jgi:hypothetical protein
MSEMSEMTCAELDEVAAELALGVLTGRERARALAHLDQCEACREDVRQLLATSEQLLGLLPEREPSAGFETRVLDRLGFPTPAPAPAAPGPVAAMPSAAGRGTEAPWTRRLLAAAAMIVVLTGVAAGGWGLGRSTAPRPASVAQAALASAVLRTPDHHSAGEVFLYRGTRGWLYMSVDDLPSGDGMVTCQLVGRNGAVTTVGSFQLADGYGSWGSPAAWTRGGISGARLVAADGTVLATATLH